MPLTPSQCMFLQKKYANVKWVVQKSRVRCFTDEEYTIAGIEVVEDISDCDVLFGVKEVPKSNLIKDKTYFYFSHTIKEQDYNRALLQKMISLNIRMIDYETLRDENKRRLIGFGRYAGVVGCYNGFLAYGLRTKRFALKPANECYDRIEMERELLKIDFTCHQNHLNRKR